MEDYECDGDQHADCIIFADSQERDKEALLSRLDALYADYERLVPLIPKDDVLYGLEQLAATYYNSGQNLPAAERAVRWIGMLSRVSSDHIDHIGDDK